MENSEAATLVETALARLRRDILTGVVAPGSKLRIEELRASYGIGASPLREALSRLVSNRLVTTEGQKGFRVAPVSKKDHRDITDTRKLLECAALSDSLKNGDADWQAHVVACYERLDREHEILHQTSGASGEAWERANDEFHEALVSACQSFWVLNFRRIIYDQAGRYRRLFILEPTIKRRAHVEHGEMMRAAVARDVEKACRLADSHAERNYNFMVELFSD
ncbi:MAG: GntR family transcriptional regulator [Alphaproteobacteria bacterium]|nr:GntR family transcriptional regulator [Alphaproteobacteria bacterium]